MNEQSTARQTHWVGMDVAKDGFDASFVRRDQHFPDTELRNIPVASFTRSEQGVKAFLSWLDSHNTDEDEVRVVMESTGHYSQELSVWLLVERATLTPAIAHAGHTAAFIKSLGVRNKTDRLEARALGFYGVERNPQAYEPLTPERAELRELSRYRDSLVQQCTRMKNQMKRDTASPFVQQNRDKRLRLLKADIERVETHMKELVKQHEDLARDIVLLSSIYGVGFISATVVIAELGDLRRFDRARPLTAFAGMSPRHYESGSSIHRRSRLCKQGNPRIRQILYLCAMIAVRGDNLHAKAYRELIDNGKPKKVALIAIMRKLLVLMRAILISGKPYQPMGIKT
ncbi:MAG: IS110 family transposase [Candidatus Hydrogenedentes bacterium]|nr:IS110 family transposase [Candidatus Hydrogenedentota bacterium]